MDTTLPLNREEVELLLINAGVWVAQLLYAASPVDLVPDFVPFLGQLDDLVGFGLALVVTGLSVRRAVARRQAEPPILDALAAESGFTDDVPGEAFGWEAYEPLPVEELRTL